MKKWMMLVPLIGFVFNCAHAALSENEATLYSIKTLLVSEQPANVKQVGTLLRIAGANIDKSVFDLAAGMAHLEAQKSNPDSVTLIWLIRIVGVSRDGRFRNVLETIRGRTQLSRVQTEAVQALDQMKATTEAEFAAEQFDLAAVRQSLQAIQAKNSAGTALGPNATKGAKKVVDTYQKLGYPDHIRMRYKFNGRKNGGGTMEAFWDNRYYITFQYRPRMHLPKAGWARSLQICA